jgi:effector-binding domain-containing protein
MPFESVVLKDIALRTVVYLRCKGPWRQLPEMLAKLEERLARTGLEAIGPASGVYYNTPNEVDAQELDWEVFHPVGSETAEAVEDEAGFGIKKLPGIRVAALIHRGSYRRAGSTYERLEEWIRQQGLRVCGPAEEVYLSVVVTPHGEQQLEIRLPVCPL